MLTSFTHIAVSWPAVGLLALTMVGVVLATHLVRIMFFDKGGTSRKGGGTRRSGSPGAKRQRAGGRKKSGRA